MTRKGDTGRPKMKELKEEIEKLRQLVEMHKAEAETWKIAALNAWDRLRVVVEGEEGK